MKWGLRFVPWILVRQAHEEEVPMPSIRFNLGSLLDWGSGGFTRSFTAKQYKELLSQFAKQNYQWIFKTFLQFDLNFS